MVSEGGRAAGDITTEQLGEGGDRVDGGSSSSSSMEHGTQPELGSGSATAPDAPAAAADPQAGQGDGSAPSEARRRDDPDNYYLRFERALARYTEDEPDRWDRVAAAVGGGKTAANVKRTYNEILADIKSIDEWNRIRIPTSNFLIIVFLVVLLAVFCQLLLLKFRPE